MLNLSYIIIIIIIIMQRLTRHVSVIRLTNRRRLHQDALDIDSEELDLFNWQCCQADIKPVVYWSEVLHCTSGPLNHRISYLPANLKMHKMLQINTPKITLEKRLTSSLKEIVFSKKSPRSHALLNCRSTIYRTYDEFTNFKSLTT